MTLAERVVQALEDNRRVLLPAVQQLVDEAKAEGIRESADLPGHLPALMRIAEILGEHRPIGGRCRCGYDPRLDWHRQETHIAEQIIAAGPSE